MASNAWIGHCTAVSSCCGISLRNGVMWIAEMCTVISIALIIFSGFAIDEILWHWHWRSSEMHLMLSMHSIALVLGAIQFVMSVMLIMAVLQERSAFMIPWIIFYSVQTVLLLLAMIVCCILIIIYIEPFPVGIMLFLISIAYVYAFRYFILVVYSYYRQLTVMTPGASSAGVMQLA